LLLLLRQLLRLLLLLVLYSRDLLGSSPHFAGGCRHHLPMGRRSDNLNNNIFLLHIGSCSCNCSRSSHSSRGVVEFNLRLQTLFYQGGKMSIYISIYTDTRYILYIDIRSSSLFSN